MKKTEIRFKAIRFRSKLSYMSFINEMTVAELLHKTMLHVCKHLEKDGLIYARPDKFSYKAYTRGMKYFE